MPQVTVLMSVYNGQRYLHEAVRSILNQTFRDYEFLIIDDGSQDESLSILKEFAKNNPCIRLLINDCHKGLGYSLRRGVAEAQGELIARMDCDDISHPERLEKQVKWLQAHPDIDILGTQALEIDVYGHVLGRRYVPTKHEDIRRLLPFANPIIHSSVMFRKLKIIAVGSYRADLQYVQDYDLWFRCMAAGLRFANLPEALVSYRLSAHYPTKKLSWEYRKTDFKVRLEGCKRLRCKRLEWLGVIIPLIIGLSPPQLSALMYRLAKRVDPRKRYGNG